MNCLNCQLEKRKGRKSRLKQFMYDLSALVYHTNSAFSININIYYSSIKTRLNWLESEVAWGHGNNTVFSIRSPGF